MKTLKDYANKAKEVAQKAKAVTQRSKDYVPNFGKRGFPAWVNQKGDITFLAWESRKDATHLVLMQGFIVGGRMINPEVVKTLAIADLKRAGLWDAFEELMNRDDSLRSHEDVTKEGN